MEGKTRNVKKECEVCMCMSAFLCKSAVNVRQSPGFTDEILRGSVPFKLALAYDTINNLSLYVLCIMIKRIWHTNTYTHTHNIYMYDIEDSSVNN